MNTEIMRIASFVLNAFLHIWPYLLITIPLSVAVKMSGAAKYINKAFNRSPGGAIILATLVGAFSPFCSCGVIPVVTTLLIGGVPLGPVMSFWIASPSMDPEIFFLSAATLGWKLAVWRLASTLVLSLSAGYITHYLVKKNLLGENYLTIGTHKEKISMKLLVKNAFNYVKDFARPKISKVPAVDVLTADLCCSTAGAGNVLVTDIQMPVSSCGCSSAAAKETSAIENTELNNDLAGSSFSFFNSAFLRKLRKETISASLMVMKFMGLAFLLEGIIELYVPQNVIINTMGGNNPLSVLWAAILGVPVYTSSLAALPMIGALIAKGMNQGSALAFLISGPITTIPAMAAVYGLVNKRVFMLYVSFAFFGAALFGYLLYFTT